jgi:hypothetical protein
VDLRQERRIIEYRGCQGTERFVRLEDGSLIPERLEEEFRKSLVRTIRFPQMSAPTATIQK